jgi:hypothetical protein
MITRDPDLLNEREAATLSDKDRRTIRKLIEQKRLPASDFGTGTRHFYMIRRQDLTQIAPKRVEIMPTTSVRRCRRHVPPTAVYEPFFPKAGA